MEFFSLQRVLKDTIGSAVLTDRVILIKGDDSDMSRKRSWLGH